MGLPTNYLSVSQVNKYLRCPKQYYYRYIENLPEPKRVPLLVGSSVHKTIETGVNRKIETGELIEEKEVEKIYTDYWQENIDTVEWEGEDEETERKRGIELAGAYLDTYGKELHPLGTEMRFNVDIAGIPFVGYIDIVEQNGFIRDIKTTKRTPPKDIAEQSLQLTSYAVAYRELTGETEAGTSLDYLIGLKTKTKVERLETTITDNRIDRLKDTVWNVGNGIENNIFPRNEGVNCSYCPFRKECLGID